MKASVSDCVARLLGCLVADYSADQFLYLSGRLWGLEWKLRVFYGTEKHQKKVNTGVQIYPPRTEQTRDRIWQRLPRWVHDRTLSWRKTVSRGSQVGAPKRKYPVRKSLCFSKISSTDPLISAALSRSLRVNFSFATFKVCFPRWKLDLLNIFTPHRNTGDFQYKKS